MADRSDEFCTRLLGWHDQHGRHDLPWQKQVSGYRVWVSEIMLQQTQVTTVVPYFRRFMERFRDIVELADADVDEVLALWAGLGYYARAHNLHKASTVVRDTYHGRFPAEFDELLSLPGIGKSTAGAIMSLAYGEPYPVLDTNIKRFYYRYFAADIEKVTRDSLDKKLWNIGKDNLPAQCCAQFTQALMDMGAMVCTKNEPRCQICPVQAGCQAKSLGRDLSLPATKKTVRKRVMRYQIVVMTDHNGPLVILEKRSPLGIWGGLLSFPEVDSKEAVSRWIEEHITRSLCSREQIRIQLLPPFRHLLTHRELVLNPCLVLLADRAVGEQHPQYSTGGNVGNDTQDHTKWQWFEVSNISGGMPASTVKILEMASEWAWARPNLPALERKASRDCC